MNTRQFRQLTFHLLLVWTTVVRADELVRTIEQVKPAVVGVGSYRKLASPPLNFIGSGFAVGNGLSIITSAHIVDDLRKTVQEQEVGILVRHGEAAEFRMARVEAIDKEHDLALLTIRGVPLPALRLGDSASVAEGRTLAFMGFPLAMVLGLRHVTHRCTVSALTPIATPASDAMRLGTRTALHLKQNAYTLFQLDGTAYPGNSGGPLFDPDTGEVLGIINMVFVKGSRESAISNPSGISYAIPSSFIKALLNRPLP